MNEKQIDARLAKLQTQLAAEHDRFINAARAAVTAVLEEYGLTLDHLTATKPTKATVKATEKAAEPVVTVKAKKATKAKKAPQAKGTRPPKYRNPETGQTWSGMGHTPQWMVNATDRNAYLIN